MSNMKITTKPPRAIDLFCGCGGLSSGLRSAGFDVLGGVDVEPNYICTYAHNFGPERALTLDLAKTEPLEFAARFGLKAGELELLVGGPPCQGFSKNVPRKQRYLESANNSLVKTFLDYAEAIRPQFVLMENVAEMKNGFDQAYSEEVITRLADAGYSVTHAVLNAADYGVPQRRRRAFFLASRSEKTPRFPMPTHTPSPRSDELFKLHPHVTVWEAISDLPSVQHDAGSSRMTYASEPRSEFQKMMRNGHKEVTNQKPRKLQPTQYERLASLKPGEGLKQLPDHLRPRSGYSGAYGRLTEDMVAPTITRWVFHPGSGRWGHPRDIRVLTIREAARIQGFPDDFEFVGTYNNQAGQLGNAVPPLLARRIAEEIRNQLAESRRSNRAMSSTSESLSQGAGKLNVIA